MKTVRIIKYAVLAMVLFAGCNKENDSSRVPEEDLQTHAQVIPVTFEGMEDTKMTMNGETGECTWTDYDNIALSYYDSMYAQYRWYYAPVVSNAVRLDLASTQFRRRFACYPGFNPDTHDYTNTITNADTPVVTYYTQANYKNGKTNDWMWAPMIAENTGQTLKFFHVGGVVRIELTNIPSDYTYMYVRFYGKQVTGNFTVTNAGTANATTSVTNSSSSYSEVRVFNLTNSGNGFYAYIPIPAGDYSALTQIEVIPHNSTFYTQSIYFPNGWGTIKHGEGRRLTFDMSASVSGGDGTIDRTYHYKPHFLKWNATESKYELFDDPLELMVHSTADDIDVYWHRGHSVETTPSGLNLKSVRYRVLGNCSTNTLPPIPIDGRYYHFGKSEINYCTIYSNSGSKLNNSNTNYIWMTVDLSDATPENGAAMDYRGKGTHNADGTRGENTNFVSGLMMLSCDMTITEANLSSTAPPKATVSYAFYKRFVDAGCLFWPCLGFFYDLNNGTVTNNVPANFYFGTLNSGYYYNMSFGYIFFNYNSGLSYSQYYLYPGLVFEGQ